MKLERYEALQYLESLFVSPPTFSEPDSNWLSSIVIGQMTIPLEVFELKTSEGPDAETYLFAANATSACDCFSSFDLDEHIEAWREINKIWPVRPNQTALILDGDVVIHTLDIDTLLKEAPSET